MCTLLLAASALRAPSLSNRVGQRVTSRLSSSFQDDLSSLSVGEIITASLDRYARRLQAPPISQRRLLRIAEATPDDWRCVIDALAPAARAKKALRKPHCFPFTLDTASSDRDQISVRRFGHSKRPCGSDAHSYTWWWKTSPIRAMRQPCAVPQRGSGCRCDALIILARRAALALAPHPHPRRWRHSASTCCRVDQHFRTSR